MPTQIQRPPSQPNPSHGGGRDSKYTEPVLLPHSSSSAAVAAAAAAAKTQQQQQLQHREALRLALGSILTPKRPQFSTASRSSSGTASPNHFAMPTPYSPVTGGGASGAQTPVGTPPIGPYFASGHGPNSSEYLHPHHGYPYHGHPYPLPPSRLGRTTSSSNSPSDSAQNTAPSSAHPSPRPGMGVGASSPAGALPLPPDIEPLPPAAAGAPQHMPMQGQAAAAHSDPEDRSGSCSHRKETEGEVIDSRRPPPPVTPMGKENEGGGMGNEDTGKAAHGHASGTNTPRARFLQTLQSKSAWDALIHGSFT